LFSADAGVVTPLSDALQVVKIALEQFGTDSARSEYCKWHGVSYHRTLRYSSTVKILESAFSRTGEYRRLPGHPRRHRLLPRPKHTPPAGEPIIDFYTNDGLRYSAAVRIEGLADEEFDAMVAEGRCPLCRQRSHILAECPFLPNEIRPFC
jgi:hypothetical protein